MAYDHGEVDLQATIKVRMATAATELVETTVGRVLLVRDLPDGDPVRDGQQGAWTRRSSPS